MLTELGYQTIPFNRIIHHQLQLYVYEYIVKHGHNLVQGTNDQLLYEKAFNKGARVFPEGLGLQIASCIKKDLWIKKLLNYKNIDLNRLCQYELDKNPTLKKDQYHVYWRLVRPFRDDDVGYAHRDSQFNALDTDRDTGIEGKSWKIWVPIAGCTLGNSLQLIPKSHLMDVKTDYVETRFGKKPIIDKLWLEKHESEFICPFTEVHLKDQRYPYAVVFHEDVVHRGPINQDNSLRISAEITIYVN